MIQKIQTRETVYVSFARTYNIYVTCGDGFSWYFVFMETVEQRRKHHHHGTCLLLGYWGQKKNR